MVRKIRSAQITGVEVGETTIRVELGADPDVFAVRDLIVILPNTK